MDGERTDGTPPARLVLGCAIGSLLLGALLGFGASYAPRPATVRTAELPDAVVATIDGAPITREEFERALTLMAADRTSPLDGRATQFALRRLVDEHLLVREALRRDLLRRDDRLRIATLETMLALATGRSAGEATTCSGCETGSTDAPATEQVFLGYVASLRQSALIAEVE